MCVTLFLVFVCVSKNNHIKTHVILNIIKRESALYRKPSTYTQTDTRTHGHTHAHTHKHTQTHTVMTHIDYLVKRVND